MNGTLFYVLGVGLAAFAVLTSFVGLRASRFPGSNGAMVAIIAAFILVVAGTTTFAVLHSQDEERPHEEEVGLPQATEKAEEEEQQ